MVRTGPLPLPNFLIIGAQRGATRWLRANLSQHPDVFMPAFEPSFFSRPDQVARQGMKGYQGQFEAWEGEACVGESSPDYLLWSNDPMRVAWTIRDRLPDVRLIAILRHPIDRMYSALLDHIKKGRLPANTDLFTLVQEKDPVVDELDLVTGGLYAASLYPYRHLFGDRLLVLFREDLAVDPEGVYASALRHIGASPDFVPRHLDRVVFSNRNTVRATGPRLTEVQARILYTLFRDDVDELEALTGRDLSEWDPGPPPPS